jgi:HPt (histidine-containing phosphotransfer) domain-containing protein
VVNKAVLDLSRLQEAFEDDVAGIADLLEMALGTGAKHTKTLRDGIAAADLTAVAKAAHGIKGSASNIGAPGVTAVAIQIEDRIRSGSWDGVAELAEALDAAYAALRETVADYRRAITTA